MRSYEQSKEMVIIYLQGGRGFFVGTWSFHKAV